MRMKGKVLNVDHDLGQIYLNDENPKTALHNDGWNVMSDL